MRSRYVANTNAQLADSLDQVSARNRTLEASQKSMQEELRAKEAQVIQLSARSAATNVSQSAGSPSNNVRVDAEVRQLRRDLQAAQEQLATRSKANSFSSDGRSDEAALAEMGELRRELNASRKEAAAATREAAAARREARDAASAQQSAQSARDSPAGSSTRLRQGRPLEAVRAELTAARSEANAWKEEALASKQDAQRAAEKISPEKNSTSSLLHGELAKKDRALKQLTKELAAAKEMAEVAASKAQRSGAAEATSPSFSEATSPLSVLEFTSLEPSAEPGPGKIAALVFPRYDGQAEKEDPAAPNVSSTRTPRELASKYGIQQTPRTHLKTVLKGASPAKGGRAHVWRQIEMEYRNSGSALRRVSS